MGKHFVAIRRKTRLSALVTAVILGIGTGVIALSVPVLICKPAGVAVSPLFYLLGLAVFVLTTVIGYFAFAPSDKRLAKRLDEEHGLDERVRTMVNYRHSNEVFMRLQREDADRQLGTLQVNPWRWRQLVATLLVLVLSMGCLTGAVLVPAKQPQGPVEAPVDDFLKQSILIDLNNMIATVEKSLMGEGLKQETLAALRGLVSFVQSHDYMSEMKLEAIDTVITVNTALQRANTAPQIGERLAESDSEELAALGAALAEMSGSKTKKSLEELQDVLKYADLDTVAITADAIDAAMGQAGADPSNQLVGTLKNLASALRASTNYTGDVESAFSGVPAAASNEVNIQNINKITMQDVISKLCSLFGITAEDLETQTGGEDVDITPPAQGDPDPEEPDPDPDDPDNPLGSGGLGTGDRVYGSNDMIYNPYTNSYVAYGEVLDEYNARATEKIVDGKITPDFAKFIEEYFQSLSEVKTEDEDKK